MHKYTYCFDQKFAQQTGILSVSMTAVNEHDAYGLLGCFMADVSDWEQALITCTRDGQPVVLPTRVVSLYKVVMLERPEAEGIMPEWVTSINVEANNCVDAAQKVAEYFQVTVDPKLVYAVR